MKVPLTPHFVKFAHALLIVVKEVADSKRTTFVPGLHEKQWILDTSTTSLTSLFSVTVACHLIASSMHNNARAIKSCAARSVRGLWMSPEGLSRLVNLVTFWCS